MPHVPIIMPQLGESIAEATIVQFLVKPGDAVSADQDVIEVETNKATMNVTAPGTGRLEKLSAKLQESYPVGAVLGYLEVSEAEAQRLGVDIPSGDESAEEKLSRTAREKKIGANIQTRRRTNRPRLAGSCACLRSQLHVSADESPDERTRIARGGPGGHCRKRRGRPGDHRRF